MGEKWVARRSHDASTWEIIKRTDGDARMFASGMREADAQELASLLNAVWRWEMD